MKIKLIISKVLHQFCNSLNSQKHKSAQNLIVVDGVCALYLI